MSAWWKSLDSDDDFRSGCRNVSHLYRQQSFSLTRTIKPYYYLKIIIIKFCKKIKILRALWLVKIQPLIAAINPWKIEVYVIKVTDHILYRFTSVVNFSRCLETIRKKKKKKKKKRKSIASNSELQTFLVSSQHPAWVVSTLNWWKEWWIKGVRNCGAASVWEYNRVLR